MVCDDVGIWCVYFGVVLLYVDLVLGCFGCG